MKPSVLLVIGLIGVLVGLGFVFPAIAQWRESGTSPLISGMLLPLGLVPTGIGLLSGVMGVRWLKS